MVATEEGLRKTLFGERRYAEVVFACVDGDPVGFALFFHNYSTFLGKPGIYLEDLFVRPEARGRGIGKRLLAWLAQTAVSAGLRPAGVGGVGLERALDRLLPQPGRGAEERVADLSPQWRPAEGAGRRRPGHLKAGRADSAAPGPVVKAACRPLRSSSRTRHARSRRCPSWDRRVRQSDPPASPA